MTTGNILGEAWKIVTQAVGRMLLAALTGFVAGAILIEVLAAFFNAGHGQVAVSIIPPSINGSAYTPFVHLVALLFGMVVAIMMAMWVLAIEAMHVVTTLARDATTLAEEALEKGVNSANAVVDALDGPDRHGFLGGQEFRTRRDQNG